MTITCFVFILMQRNKLILIRIIIRTDKKQHKRLMKYMEIKS
ncbi:hypothetical protein QGY_3179 [Clostridioides difficile 840]|nr:hypothetical protein QGC_3564 [Clostridioides difficile CD196]EQF93834.1 hypothetical protein QGY_3179 [Clostridioides difficile 840]EQI64681.1 hypothetical protein QQA_3118 [Clostridioides difficile Y343]